VVNPRRASTAGRRFGRRCVAVVQPPDNSSRPDFTPRHDTAISEAAKTLIRSLLRDIEAFCNVASRNKRALAVSTQVDDLFFRFREVAVPVNSHSYPTQACVETKA
jgi:hypothetical protein